jgi:hypothetical protein
MRAPGRAGDGLWAIPDGNDICVVEPPPAE